MITINLLKPKWVGRYTSFGFEYKTDEWNHFLIEPKAVMWSKISHPEFIEAYVISFCEVAEYLRNKQKQQ